MKKKLWIFRGTTRSVVVIAPSFRQALTKAEVKFLAIQSLTCEFNAWLAACDIRSWSLGWLEKYGGVVGPLEVIPSHIIHKRRNSLRKERNWDAVTKAFSDEDTNIDF